MRPFWAHFSFQTGRTRGVAFLPELLQFGQQTLNFWPEWAVKYQLPAIRPLMAVNGLGRSPTLTRDTTVSRCRKTAGDTNTQHRCSSREAGQDFVGPYRSALGLQLQAAARAPLRAVTVAKSKHLKAQQVHRILAPRRLKLLCQSDWRHTEHFEPT
jgi:hypothetical protein